VIRTETVQLSITGSTAAVMLNRPEVLNAANAQWMQDLNRVVDELEKVKGLRVVVMAGAGTSFCTGIDLHALATGEIGIEWFSLWEDTLRRLEMLEAITLAKLHGYVLGGGLQIALACDLRVATDTSKHGLPAVLEALIPGSGTWRLPRFIGLGRARRMVLTGELMDAPEAQRIGLLDWVVPESELDATVAHLMEQLLKGARTAQGLSKRLVTASFHTSFEEVREMYLEYQARALAAPEHRAAMNEYLQMQAQRHQEQQP
jgi:enoyl-CoA hydratase/carnithine racemase